MGHHHRQRSSCRGTAAANSRLFLFCPVRASASSCCCRCRPHISEKDDKHKFKMWDALKYKLMSQISVRGYTPAATLQYLHSSGRSFQSSPAEERNRIWKNDSSVSVCVQVLWDILRFYLNQPQLPLICVCRERAPRHDKKLISFQLS